MTRTTTTTTTTAKYAFHRTVNQICQKFSLTSAERKQISDFISKRASGEIKAEYIGFVPDDTEKMEILHGDMRITLAHSSTQNPSTVYVVTRKNVEEKKEEEIQVPAETFSYEKRYKIICATIARVRDYLRNYVRVSISDRTEIQIFNFLIEMNVKGKIAVVFTPELPGDEFGSSTRIQVDDHNLDLVFGFNRLENEFIHVLWVNCTLSEEAQQREATQRRVANFQKIWKGKKLPECLMEEVMKKLDLEAPITLEVYGIVKNWTRKRKTEKGELTFVGQTPDPKTGSFIANRPIGYVIGNRAVITSPGSEYKLIELNK